MFTLRTLPLLALLLLPAFAGPVMAEPLTARVSGGNIAVRTGPGLHYQTIGKISDGTRVTLEQCTSNEKWCLVTNLGWVNATYLVGGAAKTAVTPPRLLFNPFGGFRDRNGFDDGFGW
ncbi:SH3 domain-containing protein [Devosia epidermidihirudinis]|uniref:SH3 domain-containing protein n=1 Tax=Devosia epidermidihirudinis TaxID=1293439 RepID=UPI000697856B|nr:SH3 domain-containing protein [Devosia epidermidihirudinis]